MAKVKMKTKRGAAKRFKATGNGLKHKHAFKSHILTKMSTKRIPRCQTGRYQSWSVCVP